MLTIAALASAYRTRQTTPSATLRDLLDRIAASPLNSFISVDPETVMRQAADADAPSPARRARCMAPRG
ncbi:amidase, partial [Bordetella pertussis]